MVSAVTGISSHFSPKAFLQGLVAVILLSALLASVAYTRLPSTLRSREAKLASQIVLIERAAPPAPVAHITEISEVPAIERGAALPTAENAAPPETPPVTEESHEAPAAAIPVGNQSLATVPVAELVDKASGGTLPRIGDNGLTPFEAYKKPFASISKPTISIVIAGYGLSENLSKELATQLPGEVSFILSPYAAEPEKWQKLARKNGHEIWMQLPLQTEKFPRDDPGPQALLAHGSLAYNQHRLEWVLSRTHGYAGIAADLDTTFSDSSNMLQAVFKHAFARGIGYLELNPQAPPSLEALAVAGHTPYIRNDSYMGMTSLKALEQTARQRGHAIVVVQPQPNTVKALNTWIATLASKGFALAPVSATVTPPSSPPANPAVHEEPEGH